MSKKPIPSCGWCSVIDRGPPVGLFARSGSACCSLPFDLLLALVTALATALALAMALGLAIALVTAIPIIIMVMLIEWKDHLSCVTLQA